MVFCAEVLDPKDMAMKNNLLTSACLPLLSYRKNPHIQLCSFSPIGPCGVKEFPTRASEPSTSKQISLVLTNLIWRIIERDTLS